MELQTPSSESSNHVCISLSILDGKLAEIGLSKPGEVREGDFLPTFASTLRIALLEQEGLLTLEDLASLN